MTSMTVGTPKEDPMSKQTKRIGLSLGADLCWPLCYEQIMDRLDLRLPIGDTEIAFEIERVTIEPFDLRQACRYDLVIDRLTHWYSTSREWIKKSVLLDGLYVFNNPWAVQSMEKHTSYCAMIALGMPIPRTWMIPPKSYEPSPDLAPTLARYAKLFDLGQVGEALGYPLFIKPYDGGGWRAVTRAKTERQLKEAYDQSGRLVMNVQEAIEPFDRFVRCVGLGPQLLPVLYDPDAPLHDRYTMEHDFLSEEDASLLRDITLTINTFFGWEFNSCELLRAAPPSPEAGTWYPIDFANACPDSQVTSLHYHFPWLVSSFIRWSVFCAATGRKMRRSLDWEPYYAIAAEEMPFRERMRAYGALADQRLETARFEEFCETHLPHLDEIVWEYFGSEDAREAIHQKVVSLYPEHEIERFTELFWDRIQRWRAEQASAIESAPARGRGR